MLYTEKIRRVAIWDGIAACRVCTGDLADL
jgi:hypothetical protein